MCPNLVTPKLGLCSTLIEGLEIAEGGLNKLASSKVLPSGNVGESRGYHVRHNMSGRIL